MTSQTEREIQGNLFTHPSAELIAELCSSGVSGSLRLENKDRKSIVYFKDGRTVFAVSNARRVRLFQLILETGEIPESDLSQAPNVANDIELAAYVKGSGFISAERVSELFTHQVEAIMNDVFAWTDGDWTFSPFTRVRAGLEFNIDTQNLLIAHARGLTPEHALSRFRSVEERFYITDDARQDIPLEAEETAILLRSSGQATSLRDLTNLTGLREDQVSKAVYALWLGGLLVREHLHPAFSRELLASFRKAHLSVKQEAKMPARVAPVKASRPLSAEPQIEPADMPAPALEPVRIEDYLSRVENAATYYDALGVDPKAGLGDIKAAYLGIAKTFHPDKYHSDDPELLKRVQNAFAAIMQANETLKSQESRDLYDYRIRKELAEIDKARAAGKTLDEGRDIDQAAENFERGFAALIEGNVEAATPFLARAVHYAPKVAKYRAYYGKALSSDPKQRHKAEGEMAAAIKHDPQNATFRLLMAEFFIEVNLLKRAEGELNRLLAIFPDNREAKALLASLKG